MSKKECLEKDNNLTTPPRQDENPSVVTSKSSERRIAANRRNSALSTGPRTAKGKRASSRNAITHAILARGVVLPDGQESEEEFAELRGNLHRVYQPQDSVEELLVERIASCWWRLARVARAEVGEVVDQSVTQVQQQLTGPLDPANRVLALERSEISQELSEGDLRSRQLGEASSDTFSRLHFLSCKVREIREELQRSGSLSPAHRDLLWDYLGTLVDMGPSPGCALDPVQAADLAARLAETEKTLQSFVESVKRASDHHFNSTLARLSIPESTAADRFMRYESHLERQLYRAMYMLEQRGQWRSQSGATGQSRRCRKTPSLGLDFSRKP